MNSRFILLPLLAALPLTAALADSLVTGSAEAGKSKAAVCTACHGAEGNSINPLWPNIAGQSAPYIVAQLNAFREGTRSDPLMSPQAMMLNDEDVSDLAVYFESLAAPAMAVADADPMKINKAEALYRGGDSDSGVAACLACHGPTGRGNPAAEYPALQGQHATYTAKQLRDFSSGTRKSDGQTRIMRDIAARLDEDDITALASYIQGLRQ